MRPRNRGTPSDSQRPGRALTARNPPAMTSAAPTVGSSAAVPGNGVVVLEDDA